MSVLDVVSGLANAAAGGLRGYAIDQQTRAADILAKQKADEEARRNAVLNFVALQGVDPDVQGRLEGARARARVQPAVDEAAGLAPVHVKEAVDSATATAPITLGTHEQERTFDNAHPAPVPASFTPVVTTAQDGAQHVSTLNTKSGQLTDTGAQAKAGAATGGGIGSLSPQALAGMSQQAADADRIMTAFEKKYALDPSLVGAVSGVGAAASNAQGGGMVAGLERLAGNAALGHTNPEYQQYLAAQKRFGNIMGNLMSRRYTEHQGVLDTDLSGIHGGDALSTVQLKQSYRRDLLDHFPAPAVGAAHGASASGDPDFDALMAKYKKP